MMDCPKNPSIFENKLILENILSHLELKDLKICGQVNSLWRKEAQRQFASVENIGALLNLKSYVARLTIRNFPSFNKLLEENVDYAKLKDWAKEKGPRIKSLRIQNIKWDLNEALTESELKLAGQFMKFFTNLADVDLDIGVTTWRTESWSPPGRPLVAAGVVPSVRNVHLNVQNNSSSFDENEELASRKMKECMFGRALIKTFPNVESWTLSSTNEDQKGRQSGNPMMNNVMYAMHRVIPRFRQNLKSVCWIGAPSEISSLHRLFEEQQIQDISIKCTAPCTYRRFNDLLHGLTLGLKTSPNLRRVQASFKSPEERMQWEIKFSIPECLNMTRFKISLGNKHFEHTGSIQGGILLSIRNNSIDRIR